MEENNQEKKETEFKSVKMDNTNQVYTSFDTNTNKKTKSSKTGFGKTVVLPFFCGILGAGIVVGSCTCIPQVRDTLLKQFLTSTSSESSSNTNSTTIQDINTKLISLSGFSDTSVSVAQKVKPSIVGINVEYSISTFFNRSSTANAQGSGVIISEDGYILTNNHVVNSSSSSSYYNIEEATKITVKLYNDDTEYEAKIIGTDEQTDLAVIKIDKTGLTAAELGDSDSLQVGEFCMAVGNALGLGDSVTSGIISAVNREVTDSDKNKYLAIQTDAAINSGNSGGALVNSKGQVIGINTLKISGTGVEGVGFAIPINSTKSIYEQLIQYSKVKRPYIGITGINLTESLAKQNNLVVGIYVKSIEDFSSAEKAGIKVGDVITEVEGTKVKTIDELNEIKNKKNIGDTIKLKITRDGKEKEITLTLQEQP